MTQAAQAHWRLVTHTTSGRPTPASKPAPSPKAAPGYESRPPSTPHAYLPRTCALLWHKSIVRSSSRGQAGTHVRPSLCMPPREQYNMPDSPPPDVRLRATQSICRSTSGCTCSCPHHSCTRSSGLCVYKQISTKRTACPAPRITAFGCKWHASSSTGLRRRPRPPSRRRRLRTG